MTDNAVTHPWCLPETLTHLYYSPIYQTLTETQRRVYNRLHACYLCEFYVFFEGMFPRYYGQAATDPGMDAGLRARLVRLVEDERRHAAMFRALARYLAPDRYGEFRHYFIRLPGIGRAVLECLFRFPARFPVILWIALLQEERALYYAWEILRQAERTERRVVEAHRLHLADEEEHLAVEEGLLQRYWDGGSPWLRRLNGRLFCRVFGEFLIVPKRGGSRLIARFVEECPELREREGELRAAMGGLNGNPAFHASLYSRDIVPKTFALFDRYPEFCDLPKYLPSYTRECRP